MPFGANKDEERWFEGWYKTVIEPVVVSAGYDPILAATEDQPGAINDEIRAHLVFDPLVIVDLGGRNPVDPPNPNVMYELGIRHAFGLPLVLMAWEGQRLPFDVSNQRAIMTRRDFMDIEPARQKLARFISAAKEGRYYNPMENVGREAAIDAASLSLGEESLLGALAREVRDLRVSITSRSSRKWDRPLKVRMAVPKTQRHELWEFAKGVGLDPHTWGAFLNGMVPEGLKDEMREWSVGDWKDYLSRRAPEVIAEYKQKLEQRAARQAREAIPLSELALMAATILPEQPWPTGIHKELAEKLDIPATKASEIIQELIRQGKFKHQIDGALVEDVPAGAPRPEEAGDVNQG